MTRISIKDLTESVELDHAAMTAISGGARIARRHALPSESAARRVTQFPWDIGLGLPQEQRARTGNPSK